ncbi:HPr family phosphocarrier protein [Haloferax prahovense]|uniref:HPr family phosphocarrier protein n=1 Tax=Haloferax TaxID=2251 RepID=UPI00209C2D66|nr:HPr family phosphocarrier protein [Haloferax sp. AB510]MCO8265458.1 HPr family phosphocarrier protein [Haloferax sp. AB510]
MAAKSATVVVEHETGLHARPASMFVQTASKFETDISVRKAGGETEVDAKSSIAVLSLGVGPDEEIVITADGSDGEQAVERLVELVRNDFDLDQ